MDTRLLPRDGVGNRRLMYRTYIEEAQRFRWPGDPEYTGPDAEYCYGLRKQIAVLCDGTVVPCCLDGQGKLKLGNIFFQRMDEILGSHRAVCIRQGFDRRQPYEECASGAATPRGSTDGRREKKSGQALARLPAVLLPWYDENRRVLPWREEVTPPAHGCRR